MSVRLVDLILSRRLFNLIVTTPNMQLFLTVRNITSFTQDVMCVMIYIDSQMMGKHA